MKRTPLRKVSKKRAKENREYLKLRAEFLKARPYCEIFEPCCTRKATEIHHVNGRNGKRLLDMNQCLPTCRSCHRFITDNKKYAQEMGFTK